MTRYEILVAEPWDFAGPDGQNRFLADFDGFISGPNLPNWNERSIVLKVITPFYIQNEIVEWMIAAPRHDGHTVDEIAQEGGIVGIARVRPGVILDKGRPFAPEDVLYCMIGSLKPLKHLS